MHFRPILIVLSLLFAVSSTVIAQVFSLDLPGYTLKPGFNNLVSLNLNSQAGNTVLTDRSGSFRTDYWDGKNRTTVEIGFERGSQSGSLYAENGQMLLRHIRPWFGAYEWELLTSRSYDLLQSVNQRILAGLGLRLTLSGTQDTQTSDNVTYGVGILGEDQHVSGVRSEAIRLINYLSILHFFSPTLSVNMTGKFLPNLGNTTDYRAEWVTKFTTALSPQLSFFANFDFAYNSRPAPGVYALDSQMTNGLTWQF